MKYLQDGSHSRQPLMRLSLALTLVLLLGFWATNFAMYFSRMGLDAASVAAYYNGSEADFRRSWWQIMCERIFSIALSSRP